MLTIDVDMPDHDAPVAMTDEAVIALAVGAATKAMKLVLSDSYRCEADDIGALLRTETAQLTAMASRLSTSL